MTEENYSFPVSLKTDQTRKILLFGSFLILLVLWLINTPRVCWENRMQLVMLFATGSLPTRFTLVIVHSLSVPAAQVSIWVFY